MPTPQRVLMSWSSGKDSTWALMQLLNDPAVEVAGLVCTLNGEHQRVAMHGVRRALLETQARRLNLPIHILELPDPCGNADYERIMGAFVARARDDGVTHMAFGDLFLEDVRAYRENHLAGTGIEPLFPIWGQDTRTLARDLLAAGVSTVLTCVDTRQLPGEWVGRPFDATFLDALPASVDPCGEQGEFHSFVTDAPIFDRPIEVSLGDIVERGPFVFADLLPA